MTTAPEVKTAFGSALNEAPILQEISARLRGDTNKPYDNFQDLLNIQIPALLALAKDTHVRILPDGAPYDNIQDIQSKLSALVGDVAWLRSNESFLDANGVVTQPFSKTAANFNDVRDGFVTVNAKLDALATAVAALAAVVAAK